MDPSFDDFLTTSKRRNELVGTWGFHSHMDFTRMAYQQANVWFFEQVFNFLRSFFGLVTPDNIEVITYNATQHITRDNLNQQTFLDELMLVMKGLKEYIWTLRLNLNIVGLLRTHHDPDNPIRLQIQEPCSFIIWGGPDETGFQNFSITYSLFSGTVFSGDESRLLWSVNQPILSKSLQKWETQTGRSIEVIDSSSGDLPVFQHGFGGPDSGNEPFTPAPTIAQTPPPTDAQDFDFGF